MTEERPIEKKKARANQRVTRRRVIRPGVTTRNSSAGTTATNNALQV